MPKITFRKGLEKPEPGPRGERGERGSQGPRGETGPRGPRGETGKDGADGAAGKSAFEIWREDNPGKSKRDYAKALKGKRGERGRMGPGGSRGARGIPGQTPAPASSVIGRDGDGAVETVAVQGRAPVTIVRDANGRPTAITSTERTVEIDRDAEGVVTGTTVT